MADQRLNIIFSGEASGLDKTIDQTTGKLTVLNNKLKDTSTVGNVFGKNLASNINAANKPLSVLGNNIETLRAKLLARKDFLIKETDINKIAVYNREIVLLEGEIQRLENIGRPGFDALGNAIQQSANSFTPLIGGTRQAYSVLRQLAILIPGIGIGGIVGALGSALIGLASDIFDLSNETENATIAFDKFNSALENTKNTVDDLKFGIDFRETFRKAKAEAGGLTGGALDIFGLKEGIKSNNEQIKNLDAQADQIAKPLARINADIQKLREQQTGIEIDLRLKGFSEKEIKEKFGDPILNLIDQFKDVTTIPETAIETLDKKDQEALKQIIKLNKDLDPILKQRESLINENELSIQKILIARRKEFEKIQNDTIARARLFVKEFGDAFVVPNLDESFFKTKKELFDQSKKLLSDVKEFVGGDQTALKIKLPILITTETKVNTDDLRKFLRGIIPESEIRIQNITVPVVTDLDFKLAESLEKSFEDFQDNVIKRGIEGLKLEAKIPVEVTIDDSLNKFNIAAIEKKLDLRAQFGKLGKIGFDAFNKIDFTNLNKGLLEATKKLKDMQDLANTVAQSVGQGLANAFNNVFDAILEGKNVFKALGESVKALVVDTIKAVVQMLILKAVTRALTGGTPVPIPTSFRGGGIANPGDLSFGSLGGSRVAPTLTTRVSGTDLLFVLTQGQNTIGRAG